MLTPRLMYNSKRDRDLARKSSKKCVICGRHTKLVVDHDHATGIIRGMLCNRCNTGIGVFRDSPRLFGRAQRYLQIAIKEASRWEVVEAYIGPHLSKEQALDKIEDWKESGILNVMHETLRYDALESQEMIKEIMARYG